MPIRVIDNGSTNATASRARLSGAEVVPEPRRGYGRACWTDVKWILFCDGDGSSDRRDSEHQRHKAAAAGDFELVENRVKMLFHHLQTQARLISDLLVTPAFADKSRNFLFAPGESDKMRQTGAGRPGVRSSGGAQISALDEKMRPRHTG